MGVPTLAVFNNVWRLLCIVKSCGGPPPRRAVSTTAGAGRPGGPYALVPCIAWLAFGSTFVKPPELHLQGALLQDLRFWGFCSLGGGLPPRQRRCRHRRRGIRRCRRCRCSRRHWMGTHRWGQGGLPTPLGLRGVNAKRLQHLHLPHALGVTLGDGFAEGGKGLGEREGPEVSRAVAQITFKSSRGLGHPLAWAGGCLELSVKVADQQWCLQSPRRVVVPVGGAPEVRAA